MKLLKEIEKFIDKDDRTPQQQLSYLKQLGAMMLFSPALYKDHVVAFCGTLLSMYEKLNKESSGQEDLSAQEK